MNIRVSILETGRIRIRPSYRSQSADTPVWLRRLRVLCDRHWTEPLPINVYLIEHPEGRILFDCGESPRAASPGYFPWWQPFFCLCTDIRITPTEGIGARLAARGIDPKTDLKAVVLSHLHHDHADGLPALVGTPVFVSAAHWAAFGRPLQAALQGAVPAQWPVGFAPHILEPIGPPVGPWDKSYPITEDGRVVAVDTPGHVPGHISLVVRSDDATYLAAGDLTYDQDLLDAEITDGVNGDPHEAVESLRKVKEYARQVPLVVLPAHDPHAAHRLENAEVFMPS